MNIDKLFTGIKNKENILGYIIVSDAPSKFHHFDYYIIFNSEAEIAASHTEPS